MALGYLAMGCAPDAIIAGEDAAAPMDAAVMAPVDAAHVVETPHAKRRLRLLTRAEYDNTITDLTGLPSTWGAAFPAEVVVAGFDNNAAAGMVGALLADKVRGAAEEIAAALVGKGIAELTHCPGNVMNDSCVLTFIATFGKRAFRRPLSDAEQMDYFRDVYSPTAAEDGFAAGIQWTVTALLQSPHFLYRAELGPAMPAPGAPVPLTDYEIATELSYLLTASMPDEALLSAADDGALHNADQIAAAAHRLFTSPKSRAALDRFVTQWLKLDAVLVAPKDARVYPDFTPTIRAAMLAESRELFDRTMRTTPGARLPDLFATPYSYMSVDLARFYGLPPLPIETLPGGLGRWNVSGVHRGGILVGSPLAAQGKATMSAPVHRGKLVREQLLCQPLMPPPAGFNLDLPSVPPGSSQREQLVAHSKDPRCASCHDLMDTIGFGLERYDGVGRYGELAGNQVIDDSGEIKQSTRTAGAFHGALELELKLAASRDVAECFALQWYRFAWGAQESAESAALVEEATRAFVAGNLALEPLLLAIVRSADFRLRL